MSDASKTGICTLMVLRHAEKDAGRDPSLSTKGKERAKTLARLLCGVSITRLLCTEYRRTRETIEPLAAAVGCEIETISAEDSPAWRKALSGVKAGQCVVICGHQNTVPQFVEATGGKVSGTQQISGQAWIPGHVFDRLFIVSWAASEPIPASSAVSLELRYGASSDPQES
ncbi:MAG: histidine phosphatase family protein [Planctomycetes bacterium]|nr:histidine phosphatase family protein [Planctomycetota bacterium]